MITLAQAYELIGEELQRAPGTRMGEAAWNVMYAMYPESSARLEGTIHDPFYHSERVGMFLYHLGIR